MPLEALGLMAKLDLLVHLDKMADPDPQDLLDLVVHQV